MIEGRHLGVRFVKLVEVLGEAAGGCQPQSKLLELLANVLSNLEGFVKPALVKRNLDLVQAALEALQRGCILGEILLGGSPAGRSGAQSRCPVLRASGAFDGEHRVPHREDQVFFWLMAHTAAPKGAAGPPTSTVTWPSAGSGTRATGPRSR